MEKNIKMSLETARDLWKLLKQHENPEYMAVFHIIKVNFTKEELEGDEGYTWEKAFDGGGYFIENSSEILRCASTIKKTNKNVFKTEAQAKSALALAQLSHICAAANEGKKKGNSWYSIKRECGELKLYTCFETEFQLIFFKEKDAETSLRVNRELWEQYHMI